MKYSGNFTLVALACVVGGCASFRGGESVAPDWDSYTAPVYSLQTEREDMYVKVSPAARNLRVFGTAGSILGLVVDAVANDRYRRALLDALGNYDLADGFTGELEEALRRSLPGEVRKVPPPGSAARFPNRRAYAEARYKALARAGADSVIDLKISYGIFGLDGDLAAEIKGAMRAVPDGTLIWRDRMLVLDGPILGRERPDDPTNDFLPTFWRPRLLPDSSTRAKWTKERGTILRAAFEEAVDGAIAALLTCLEAEESGMGYVYLGRRAYTERRYSDAEEHFRRAAELDPESAEPLNGLAVAVARQDRPREAFAIAEELTVTHPGFAPGWLNLAWILGELLGDREGAAWAYERSRIPGNSPYADRQFQSDAVVPDRLSERGFGASDTVDN